MASNARIVRHACNRLIIDGQTCICANLDRELTAGIGATQMRNKSAKRS